MIDETKQCFLHERVLVQVCRIGLGQEKTEEVWPVTVTLP